MRMEEWVSESLKFLFKLFGNVILLSIVLWFAVMGLKMTLFTIMAVWGDIHRPSRDKLVQLIDNIKAKRGKRNRV